MTNTTYPVKRNEEIDVKIVGSAFGGKGVTRRGDYVIFVNNTLPGDIVKARIYNRKRNYAEARVLQILEPSKLRIDAPCPYFEWCGGCTWQNLSYKDQLSIKKDHVIESLEHLAGLKKITVYDTLPSPRIWSYRNKMEFSFSDRRWLLPDELGNANITREYALGLHIPGTFDKILDVDYCFLQSEKANNVLHTVDEFVVKSNMQPYGLKSHEGFLRFLVIRESDYTGEILVNIVTAYKNIKELKKLAQILRNKIPEVTGVVNTINPRKAQIATGDEVVTLEGKDHITEKLGRFEFRISSNSFFQTNTLQAERLYRKVIEFAALDGHESVWDLYCGTGTITLLLAERAHRVIGFELAPAAIEDAINNASVYNIENVSFISGDLTEQIKKTDSVPDVIIVDPPRSGMHPKVCSAVSESGAKRIIYVSCNPTTLARDIRILSQNYILKHVQPVDMFPHTYHIESIAAMERI